MTDPDGVIIPVADSEKKDDDPTNSFGRSTVYLVPESFNALRRELEQNWPNLWNSPLQYFMAFQPQRFVTSMDEALDLVTQFDSGNVDGICKRYLDKLREKRGLKALHNSSEYFHNQQMEDSVKFARQIHEQPFWKQ